MDRVMYFPPSDLSVSHYLMMSERVIRNFDPVRKFDTYTINDIIEFSNIVKYIDDGAKLTRWVPEDTELFQSVSKEYQKIIGKYLNYLEDEKILDEYKSLNPGYKMYFWKLIEKYKRHKTISYDAMNVIIRNPQVSVRYILECKDIVNNFGQIIKEKILDDVKSAEILLNKYEVDKPNAGGELFLPKELTIEDKEKIICNYINSSEVNSNYLQLIIDLQSSPDFSISTRTRLNAKNRKNEEMQKLFESNTGITTEITVSMNQNQEEEKMLENDGMNLRLSYSSQWIKENNDYSTLLNNFIYLFEYADLQMRITLVNKKNELGIFEKYMTVRSKRQYFIGFSFLHKDRVASLQMFAYYQKLNNLNIRLEDVVEWFFKIYLDDEFSARDFRVKMPSAQSLFFEKCRSILPEMESALKQYRLYVEEGKVEHELLQMSSEPLLYKDIPSQVKNKYVYGKGDEYKQAAFYFFSDQCMLAYVERFEEAHKTFYELFTKENLNYDDYHDVDKRDIDWLVEHLYIAKDESGFIKPFCLDKLLIMHDLFDNGVICFWHYPQKYRIIILEMEQSGIVEFANTLFSQLEQEYFNYFLNKASFSNALDLRNMYSHGTQPSGEGNEKTHAENYLVFLRLFILAIIKINDEFCIADSKEYRESYMI